MAFARHANGITGSDAVMPDNMKGASSIVVPAELVAKGQFIPTCGAKAKEDITAIWTGLQK